MFRVGKCNVQCPAHSLRRRMSLAKRLINAHQQMSGGSGRERMATPRPSAIGKPPKKPSASSDQEQTTNLRWPRKIFSGIQPTGSLHLGNYLGAVRKWTTLQKSNDNITLCIVDMHSITLPHNPPVLRENIFTMAATLLACGVDPSQATLFVQSAVPEHCEFNWILGTLSTMPRLAQLPQFKEKSRTVRDVPLGLYVYPVLQAADIMLYKATHVPVGADQLQHIQLAQHLTRSFNARYGEMFPVCQPMIEEDDGSRILSLRDPSKKMSKSDQDIKSTINLSDSPEQITEKIKKALTDFTSDISYNPSMRPGVSNLVNIHAHVTNQKIKTVVEEANRLDTAKYKERVAEAVIEHLRPIREKIAIQLSNRSELVYVLEMGAEKGRKLAQQTMAEVKQRLGLGTAGTLPASVSVAPLLPERSRITASQRLAKGVLHPDANAHTQPHLEQRSEAGHANIKYPAGGTAGDPATGSLDANGMAPALRPMRRPVVPVQSLRVEKSQNLGPPRHVFKMDTFNVPKIGFQAPSGNPRIDQRHRVASTSQLGFAKMPLGAVNSISGFKYGQNANPSALASVTRQVNAVHRQQEVCSSLANSAYYKAAASSYNNISPSVVNVAVGSRRNKMNPSSSAADKADSTSSSGAVSSSSVASTNESNDAAEEVEDVEAEEQEDEDDKQAVGTAETTKMEN